jgi:uncharacterized protein
MSHFLVERDVKVECRDGVSLATDIYICGSGRRPSLLQRLPYGKSRQSALYGSLDVFRALAHGYNVVIQDVRGRHGSQGLFEPFEREAEDGADTISWISHQNWSDGNIGMFGRSYGGATQWLAAGAAPPALKAIAPMMCGWGFPRDWITPNNCFELGFAMWWSAAHLAPAELVRKRVAADVCSPSPLSLADRIDQLYWEPSSLLTLNESTAIPFSRRWVETAERMLEGHASDLPTLTANLEAYSIPAFHIGGWFDCFGGSTIAAYELISRVHGATKHKLVVGPWAHGAPLQGSYIDRLFGLRASADGSDLTGMQLRWFDLWLAGRQEHYQWAAKVFHMGPNVWSDYPSWPPPASTLTFFLVSDSTDVNVRRLATAPCRAESIVYLTYDADRPTPTAGGRTFLPGLEVAANAGPRDQRILDRRIDILRYASEPLSADLQVAGTATVELALREDNTARFVVAKLIEVTLDGKAMLVSDTATSVRPGAGVVRLPMSPTCYTFPQGSRIRLDISCGDYPRFDRRAGSRSGSATLAFTSGAETPSRLMLPRVRSTSTSFRA